MAFISNSIARMLFGARHEETTSRTVASAVSGHTRQSLLKTESQSQYRFESISGRKFMEFECITIEHARRNNINS